MSTPLHHLKSQLFQQIDQLYQRYASQSERKIFAKFDRTLFSESFETVGFYLQEISQTLTILDRLDALQIAQFEYITQKLTAQCTALSEALNAKPEPRAKSAVHFPAKVATTAQINIHTLPPVQRLEKYYEALHALNDKIDMLNSLEHDAQSQAQRAIYAEQVAITQQRKQRCLDAIELLEEYLAHHINT